MSDTPSISRALSRLLDLTDELKFNREDPQQLAAICLFARMLELAIGVSSLAECRAPAGIPVLVRAILEAYASFLNVVKSAEHTDHLLARCLHEKIRVIKASLKGGEANPLLADLASDGDARAVLTEFERLLSEVRQRGGRTLKVQESFELAGLKSEYESLYWLLSLDSHNDLQALANRHIHVAGEEVHVRMLEPEVPSTLRSSFHVVLSACLNAHLHLREFFGVPASGAFNTSLGEIRALEDSLGDSGEE